MPGYEKLTAGILSKFCFRILAQCFQIVWFDQRRYNLEHRTIACLCSSFHLNPKYDKIFLRKKKVFYEKIFFKIQLTSSAQGRIVNSDTYLIYWSTRKTIKPDFRHPIMDQLKNSNAPLIKCTTKKARVSGIIEKSLIQLCERSEFCLQFE